ncbi:MAG TPA: BCD family MFS transporter [Candidatus Binatia bacterium]|jgi:BCD family chlorophyll transporter-like MFS transporter|nr:BCD family MFS transporter [Candidatus Binatia bacterium]
MPDSEQRHPWRLGLILRLCTFQIGSAMGDILTASVWNRIMISDLGLPAWPVGLLIALRYLLSPLSLWAGHRSDTRPLWGRQRTSYIWLGRGLMVLSFPLLGVSVGRLGTERGDMLGWLAAGACFLLYGLGTLLSGSPFLALVRDSAPRQKQGLAISMVETTLIALFPVVAVGFGRWMQSYDEALFWDLVLTTMIVGGFFWFFAVAGAERRLADDTVVDNAAVPRGTVWSFRQTFGDILGDRRTRLFFVFLSLATFSAWMQDNILEPFGGDVFGMDVGRTTRFTGYWGAATVLTLVASFYLFRRRPPERVMGITQAGLAVMAVGMGMIAAAGLIASEALIGPALLVFGAGFGLYTFGGLSLMAAMSPDPHAGAYLGLWTVSVLIFKGMGTFVGGLLRDLFLLWAGYTAGASYGLAFSAAAIGLILALWLLSYLDVVGFVRDRGAGLGRPSGGEIGALS